MSNSVRVFNFTYILLFYYSCSDGMALYWKEISLGIIENIEQEYDRNFMISDR